MTKRNMITPAVAVNIKEHVMFPLIAMVFALALAGCQKDDDDNSENAQYHTVELITGMNNLTDGGEITRALPTGYSPFNPGTTNPGRIGMFMTQSPVVGVDYTYTTTTGYYEWSTSDLKWRSSVSVKYLDGGNNNYYAYGYMPTGSGIAPIIESTDFSANAKMTLNNVPPVMAQDLCIITGVLTGTPTDPSADPLVYPSITDINIKEGEYLYTATASSNAIYLLLKHIYSKYTLQMKVDADYNDMRTIKVTDMKMSASAPALKIIVNYSHGSAPAVSMSSLSTSSSQETDILNTETALTTSALPLTSFYCANALEYITLITTFDVYDKAGNKLRSNCKTTNKIKVQNLEAGKAYTITATIKPTYLYQLGETDLNQPSVVL